MERGQGEITFRRIILGKEGVRKLRNAIKILPANLGSKSRGRKRKAQDTEADPQIQNQRIQEREFQKESEKPDT